MVMPNRDFFDEICDEAKGIMEEVSKDGRTSPRAIADTLVERNRKRLDRDPEYCASMVMFLTVFNAEMEKANLEDKCEGDKDE